MKHLGESSSAAPLWQQQFLSYIWWETPILVVGEEKKITCQNCGLCLGKRSCSKCVCKCVRFFDSFPIKRREFFCAIAWRGISAARLIRQPTNEQPFVTFCQKMYQFFEPIFLNQFPLFSCFQSHLPTRHTEFGTILAHSKKTLSRAWAGIFLSAHLLKMLQDIFKKTYQVMLQIGK